MEQRAFKNTLIVAYFCNAYGHNQGTLSKVFVREYLLTQIELLYYLRIFTKDFPIEQHVLDTNAGKQLS
jgi:hypothetical protein